MVKTPFKSKTLSATQFLYSSAPSLHVYLPVKCNVSYTKLLGKLLKGLKERLKHLVQWQLLFLSSLVLIRRQYRIEERACALGSGKFPIVYQLGHLGQ